MEVWCNISLYTIFQVNIEVTATHIHGTALIHINILPSIRDLYYSLRQIKVNPSQNCNYNRNRAISCDVKYVIFLSGARENSNFINSTPFCRKTATKINANVSERLHGE
jgi:hypothetical protein